MEGNLCGIISQREFGVYFNMDVDLVITSSNEIPLILNVKKVNVDH